MEKIYRGRGGLSRFDVAVSVEKKKGKGGWMDGWMVNRFGEGKREPIRSFPLVSRYRGERMVGPSERSGPRVSS